MTDVVKVTELEHRGRHRLWLAFSDGSEGEWDGSELFEIGGPMVLPLKDPDFFGRVFVQLGVPVWPNGFAVDAMRLHLDLKARRELIRSGSPVSSAAAG